MQVKKIAEEAKAEIQKARMDAGGQSSFQGKPKTGRIALTETKQPRDVSKRYAINEEIEMGSDDSFDSDQQREIALLDQQWCDLVDSYIGDHDLMDAPPNEDSRWVMDQANASGSHHRVDSENFRTPRNETEPRKSIRNMQTEDRSMSRNIGFLSTARRPIKQDSSEAYGGYHTHTKQPSNGARNILGAGGAITGSKSGRVQSGSGSERRH